MLATGEPPVTYSCTIFKFSYQTISVAPCLAPEGLLPNGTCGLCNAPHVLLPDGTCGLCPAPQGLLSTGTCGLCVAPEGLRSDGTCGPCDPALEVFAHDSCLKCNGPEGLLPNNTCGVMDYGWIASGGCATADEDYPPEMSPDRVREI